MSDEEKDLKARDSAANPEERSKETAAGKENEQNNTTEEKTEEKKSFCKRHKILSSILGVIVVLLAAFLIFTGPIVKFCIEQFAPAAVGMPVTIGVLDIKLLQGKIAVRDFRLGDSSGLNSEHFVILNQIDVDLKEGSVDVSDILIANPKGFHSKHILKLKKARLDLEPDSLFEEKLVIDELTVAGLDLYYEPNVQGNNNIEALQEYIEKMFPKPTEKEKKEGTKKEPQKLQVDDLNLTDINLHTVMLGQELVIPMIPIELEDLGEGPEGITASDVSLVILDKLSLGAVDAIAQYAKNIGGETKKFIKNLESQSKQSLKEAKKSFKDIKNLFRSKKD